MIVNAGSAGYVFDGEPTASWALIDIDGDDVTAEIRRTEFDALSVANAIRPAASPATSIGRPPSGPAGSCDDRAARPDAGRAAARRRDRMGMLSALGNDVACDLGRALVAGQSGVAPDRPRSIRRASTSRIAGEVQDFDPSGVLDRKDQRRTDRYIQFGLVAARQAMDQAGPAGPARGRRWPRGPA